MAQNGSNSSFDRLDPMMYLWIVKNFVVDNQQPPFLLGHVDFDPESGQFIIDRGGVVDTGALRKLTLSEERLQKVADVLSGCTYKIGSDGPISFMRFPSTGETSCRVCGNTVSWTKEMTNRLIPNHLASSLAIDLGGLLALLKERHSLEHVLKNAASLRSLSCMICAEEMPSLKSALQHFVLNHNDFLQSFQKPKLIIAQPHHPVLDHPSAPKRTEETPLQDTTSETTGNSDHEVVADDAGTADFPNGAGASVLTTNETKRTFTPKAGDTTGSPNPVTTVQSPETASTPAVVDVNGCPGSSLNNRTSNAKQHSPTPKYTLEQSSMCSKIGSEPTPADVEGSLTPKVSETSSVLVKVWGCPNLSPTASPKIKPSPAKVFAGNPERLEEANIDASGLCEDIVMSRDLDSGKPTTSKTTAPDLKEQVVNFVSLEKDLVISSGDEERGENSSRTLDDVIDPFLSSSADQQQNESGDMSLKFDDGDRETETVPTLEESYSDLFPASKGMLVPVLDDVIRSRSVTPKFGSGSQPSETEVLLKSDLPSSSAKTEKSAAVIEISQDRDKQMLELEDQPKTSLVNHAASKASTNVTRSITGAEIGLQPVIEPMEVETEKKTQFREETDQTFVHEQSPIRNNTGALVSKIGPIESIAKSSNSFDAKNLRSHTVTRSVAKSSDSKEPASVGSKIHLRSFEIRLKRVKLEADEVAASSSGSTLKKRSRQPHVILSTPIGAPAGDSRLFVDNQNFHPIRYISKAPKNYPSINDDDRSDDATSSVSLNTRSRAPISSDMYGFVGSSRSTAQVASCQSGLEVQAVGRRSADRRSVGQPLGDLERDYAAPSTAAGCRDAGSSRVKKPRLNRAGKQQQTRLPVSEAEPAITLCLEKQKKFHSSLTCSNGVQGFPCPACMERFETLPEADKHYKTNHWGRQIVCAFCYYKTSIYRFAHRHASEHACGLPRSRHRHNSAKKKSDGFPALMRNYDMFVKLFPDVAPESCSGSEIVEYLTRGQLAAKDHNQVESEDEL